MKRSTCESNSDEGRQLRQLDFGSNSHLNEGCWINRSAKEADPNKPRLLLLCDYRPREASTVIDHIDAIRRLSRASVYVLPSLGDIPDDLDLEAFDGLIIHYNIIMSDDEYLSPLTRWRISRYSGVKAAFIQDEYRFVDATVSVMRALGIEILFSCVPSDQVDKVYPRSRLPKLAKIANVLTGYVPDTLRSAAVVPYESRTIDVGYRGRRLPPWLGELAQDKVVIADQFVADAAASGLKLDISCDESDRLYGRAWTDFVGACRAVLGVESGASVFDFDGSIEAAVRNHLAHHPGTPFKELQGLFFADAEGRIRLNQISPRSFEAAALGTLQVLYPGDYSGILQPWRHYVPLARDHSNIAEVVETIRDPVRWGEITARARDEVALNPLYSYQSMVDTVDSAMDLQPTGRPGIDAARFVQVASRSYARLRHVRLGAFGAPQTINRARLAIALFLRPSAIKVAPSAARQGERLHGLRSTIRLCQAVAYWLLRPDLLPWRDLARGGRRLLEDLAELRRVQAVGRRATTTTGLSPYVLTASNEAGELWIETRSEGTVAEHAIPQDLSWARSISFKLDDRWLVPVGQSGRTHMTLKGLSAVLQRNPGIARRLVAGGKPWCSVALTPT